MGRPKAYEPRVQQLNLSFTQSELESIKLRAQALGMRPAHFGRAMLLDTTSSPSNSIDVPAVNRLVHNQLIRLGNNLNQAVRQFYVTGAAMPSDLEPLLADIRSLIARLA